VPGSPWPERLPWSRCRWEAASRVSGGVGCVVAPGRGAEHGCRQGGGRRSVKGTLPQQARAQHRVAEDLHGDEGACPPQPAGKHGATPAGHEPDERSDLTAREHGQAHDMLAVPRARGERGGPESLWSRPSTRALAPQAQGREPGAGSTGAPGDQAPSATRCRSSRATVVPRLPVRCLPLPVRCLPVHGAAGDRAPPRASRRCGASRPPWSHAPVAGGRRGGTRPRAGGPTPKAGCACW
jgi:hypothetical protein